MGEFFDSLIGFAYLCVAVTLSIVAILGCVVVLLTIAGFLWGCARTLREKVAPRTPKIEESAS